MFAYWSRVLELEMIVLQTIHSIRSADFDDFVKSLTLLVPWYFSFDHTHYARWLSVHLRDLCQLEKLPAVRQAFLNGNFVLNKTKKPFSSIALDHAHEQCNAEIKGDGGFIGLTSNPASLRRWMVAGPAVAEILADLEKQLFPDDSKSSLKHHEMNRAFQKSFRGQVERLVASFEEEGNPFKDDSGMLYSMDPSKAVVGTNAIQTVFDLPQIGHSQYNDFVDKRLVNRTVKLTAPLTRNNLAVFVKRKTTQATTSNNLKKDVSLFSRLFIACQVRKGDLPAFFSHENSAYPPSLSKEGKLRGGHKADLLKCLEASPEPTLSNVLLDQVEDVESDTELLLLDANLDEIMSEIPVLEDASWE